MRHKRIIAVTVVVFVFVALVGISLLLYITQSKPTVLSAATSAVTPTPISPKATLEVFQDPVFVMLPDREATEAAHTGMTIPQGTIVSTGTTGRAQIMYPGGTVTRIDTSTSIKLSTYNSQKYQIVVDIFQGRVWSRIKKLLGNESYETKTHNTVATVRGTSYTHSVTELDIDSLLVLDGKVDFGCYENMKLKTSLAANKKAQVQCKTDSVLDQSDVTNVDLDQEWVKFNKEKNKVLEGNLKKGIDPAITQATPDKETVEKNKEVKKNDTTNEKNDPFDKADKKDKETGKDKEKKNPSPTSILNVQPTGIVGTVNSTVDTVVNTVDTTVNSVVSIIPTIPPLLRAPTNTPVPPTQAPAATATPDAPGNSGIRLNINVGDLNVGVGLGNGKSKNN